MSDKLSLNLNYFEQIILLKLLSDNRYANLVIDKLQPSYFENKDRKIIFNLIKTFYTEKEKLPTVGELKQYLSTNELQQSFLSVINELKSIDKIFDENEIIINTERFVKERGIMDVIWNVAKQENIKPDEILLKIQHICDTTFVSDTGINLYNDIDYIIDKLSIPDNHISTGWKWLDNTIKGGFLKDGNALYVFYGKPNIGKSIVLGNMADNIAKQGYNSMIITLEMNEISYAERLLSRITQIKTTDLVKDIDLLKTRIEENKRGNIFIKEFPTATITPQFIRSYIEQLLKSDIKIDALIIDYIDLIAWPGNDPDYIKKKKIAEHLRGTSKILKIPVISADQTRRESYSETPDMADAAGSTGNNVTADLLVGLSRNDDDIELGLIRANIMKNRNGPKDIVKVMKIDFDTLNIYEDETLDKTIENEETYNMFEEMDIDNGTK